MFVALSLHSWPRRRKELLAQAAALELELHLASKYELLGRRMAAADLYPLQVCSPEIFESRPAV